MYKERANASLRALTCNAITTLLSILWHSHRYAIVSQFKERFAQRSRKAVVSVAVSTFAPHMDCIMGSVKIVASTFEGIDM